MVTPIFSVMTRRALELVAAGSPMNFAGSELFELYGGEDGSGFRLIYSKDDREGSPLVYIADSDIVSVVPPPASPISRGSLRPNA